MSNGEWVTMCLIFAAMCDILIVVMLREQDVAGAVIAALLSLTWLWVSTFRFGG